MVRVRSLPIVLCAGVVLLASRPAAAQPVVTFENATLNQPPLTSPNTFQNGATINPPGSFASAGATFNNTYFPPSPPFSDSFSGWAYSNVVDTTTPGFGNQYAAYHLPNGRGDNSSNYGVAFNFSVGDATVDLPAGAAPASVRVTNTTYAALSIRDGDSFAKKFGGPTGNDPDFFRLTILGANAAGVPTGAVDFLLADYRFADNARDYIVDEWTTVDLSGLAPGTTRLTFALVSSDVGMFGMNTPAYFAADNLVLTPVPEPGFVLAAGVVGCGYWRWGRRRPRPGTTVKQVV